MGKTCIPRSLKSAVFLVVLLALSQSALASITRWEGQGFINYEFEGALETRELFGHFDVDTDADVVVDFSLRVIRDFGKFTARVYEYSSTNGSFVSLSNDGLFVVNSFAGNSLDFHLPGADFFSPDSTEAFGSLAEVRGTEFYFWQDAIEFYGAVQTAPVPEPEIYAMMGLGLGLLGWVGRRRKTAASCR